MTDAAPLAQLEGPQILDVRIRLARGRPRRAAGAAIGRSSRGVALLQDGTLTDVPLDASDPVVALETGGATILWPALWSTDAEEYHVLVPGRAALADLMVALRHHGDVRIDAVAQMRANNAATALGPAALGARLTGRQLRALTAAIDRGYYDIPRRVEVTTMAREFGVSRATLQEHLRKAERVALHGLSRSLAIVEQMGDDACKGRGRPRRLAPVAGSKA